MPNRRAALDKLKQDRTWSCALGAPPGRVRFACPDCMALTTIFEPGPFACSSCGAAFEAVARNLSATFHSFVIRREATGEALAS